jgi:hypothetical protein
MLEPAIAHVSFLRKSEMASFTRFLLAIRATLASTVALSVVSTTQVEAQSEASQAYLTARESGSITALERFIERYPLSPEANSAFCDIVVLSRESRLSNQGPGGLCSTSIIVNSGDTRSIARQVSIY